MRRVLRVGCCLLVLLVVGRCVLFAVTSFVVQCSLFVVRCSLFVVRCS